MMYCIMNPGFYSLYCKLGCNDFNKQLGSLHPETQNTVTVSRIKRERKFYSIYSIREFRMDLLQSHV
jgi:hypothetical protein